MSEAAKSIRITINYENGGVSVFQRIASDSDEWMVELDGLIIGGYRPSDVLRVVSNSLGTKEIAE